MIKEYYFCHLYTRERDCIVYHSNPAYACIQCPEYDSEFDYYCDRCQELLEEEAPVSPTAPHLCKWCRKIMKGE